MQQGATQPPARPFKRYNTKAFAVVGLIGAALAILPFGLMKVLFNASLLAQAPGFVQGLIFSLPAEGILIAAGVCVIASAATCVGLYFEGGSRPQTAMGMVAAVAFALLGMTMFLVASMYRAVLVTMQHLDAAFFLFGIFPMALMALACLAGVLLSATFAVSARGAARPLAIVAAALFIVGIAMMAVDLFGALEGIFYKPLEDMWPLSPAVLALSLAALANPKKELA